jgi:hypothetical protein
MADDTPPLDLPWDAEPLTGRSLTMYEYLDAVLLWVRRHYREIDESWHKPFPDDGARRDDLRRYIQDREQRKMLRRVGQGESWQAIKASTRGGRLD